MKTQATQILVDLENVPHALSALEKMVNANTVVFVFHNTTQAKRVARIRSELEAKNVTARFMKLDKAGDNALDFHMTFFLGWALHANPDGRFRVFTNDTGFDSLIDRLRKDGRDVTRVAIPIPARKKTQATTKTAESGKMTEPPSTKKNPALSPAKKAIPTPKKKTGSSENKPPVPVPSKTKNPLTSSPKVASANTASTAHPKRRTQPASVSRPATEIAILATDYFSKHKNMPRPRTMTSLRNDIKDQLKKHALSKMDVEAIIVRLHSLGFKVRSQRK